MNKEEKIKEILNSLPVDKDLIDCITIEMIDLKRPFESILNMIYNRRTPYKMFSDSKEVMDYLSANDTDLSNSLNIANTVGLSLLDINSRVLAILLFESKRMNEFYSLKDRINEFFNNINYGK